MKKNILFVAVISILLLTGCGSVSLVSNSESDQAKKFLPPSPGKSGIYIYRQNRFIGGGVRRGLWIDNECIGRTKNAIFYYHEVDGDKEHNISTEGEFEPYTIVIYTESGKLYFVEQKIVFGLVIGGSEIEVIDEKQAKPILLGLSRGSSFSMANKGNCTPGLL